MLSFWSSAEINVVKATDLCLRMSWENEFAERWDVSSWRVRRGGRELNDPV